MKSTARTYLDKLLIQNSKYIVGDVLNVGGGPVPYRHLGKNMVNIDLFISPEVDIKADVTMNFPIKKERFDTVICTQVLEHVENPKKVLEEIYKVTKRAGTLILSTPFQERYHACPKDYWRFTEDGLRVLLKNKFEIIHIYPFGGRAIWFACFMHSHRIIPRYCIRIIDHIAFIIDKYEKNKSLWAYGYLIVAKKVTSGK